jgi:hypothetical protein
MDNLDATDKIALYMINVGVIRNALIITGGGGNFIRVETVACLEV